MTIPSDDDQKLARLIGISAATFEAVFDRAKPLPKDGGPAIALGSLIDGNTTSEQKIAGAIAYAREGGWLHKLIEHYVMGGEAPEDDADALLQEARRQRLIKKNSTLQTIADARRGFGAAGLEYYHLAQIIRQVCRIDIDGQAKGTGFLVRPHIVMTAYHVVRDLVTVAPKLGTGNGEVKVQAKADTAKRIRIIFDDLDVFQSGYRTRRPGFSVAVAPDWLLGASPCHDLELIDSFPDDPNELQAKLDYALIALSGARIGILPVSLKRGRAVAMDEPISIFQHPGGRSLSVDRAKVVELSGEWRFKHNVNSEGGSSGSPCFDRDFEVVGVHQAGRARAANRAVPIRPILPKLKDLPAPDPSLIPLSELSEERPGHPVLGRTETQKWVWRQLTAPEKPVLVLRGNPGEGKSFTFDMLRSLLPRASHDVVRLAAVEDVQKLAPEAFAARLLERLHYAPIPPTVIDQGNTERPRWLGDTHLPALMQAIEAGRAQDAKHVWVVIDDIDKAVIGASTEIGEYLFRFYASVRGRNWLHFILLGYDGKLTDDLRPLVDRYDLTFPSEDDVKAYVWAKLPPQAQDNFDIIFNGLWTLIQARQDEVVRAKQLETMQSDLSRVVQSWK